MRVCLVSRELQPFSGTGPGWMLHQQILAHRAEPGSIDLHVVLTGDAGASSESFAAWFGTAATLHVLPPRSDSWPLLRASEKYLYPPAWAFRCVDHAESSAIMIALSKLEHDGLRFDLIEFPDQGGLAFCALQEKRLGRAFQQSEIVVRLCRSLSLEQSTNPTPISWPLLTSFELERKTLQDADRVLAPSAVVRDAYQSHFDFDDRWASTVTLTRPHEPFTVRETLPPSKHASALSVSVVVTNYNLAEWLPDALASVAAARDVDAECIVVDDASTNPADLELLQQLERKAAQPHAKLRILRHTHNLGPSAARNRGIAASNRDYVLVLDGDDRLSHEFLALAVRALDHHPEYDVVVPTTGYFVSNESLAAGEFSTYATYLGEGLSLGIVENSLSSVTALVRRSVLAEFAFDSALDGVEDWHLWLRLALSKKRFLVTNDVHLFYRQRPDSLSKRALTPQGHRSLHERLLETLPRPLPAHVRYSSLLLRTTITATPIVPKIEVEQVRRPGILGHFRRLWVGSNAS